LMVHEEDGERGVGWSGGKDWGQRNLPWPSDYERTHSLARRTAHILKSTLNGSFR
jgi:hypothetical protein